MNVIFNMVVECINFIFQLFGTNGWDQFIVEEHLHSFIQSHKELIIGFEIEVSPLPAVQDLLAQLHIA